MIIMEKSGEALESRTRATGIEIRANVVDLPFLSVDLDHENNQVVIRFPEDKIELTVPAPPASDMGQPRVSGARYTDEAIPAGITRENLKEGFERAKDVKLPPG